MLVVPRATHGVVPKVVGLELATARRRLRKLHLDPRVTRLTDGDPGRVLAQRPRAGVAAANNMTVRLVVGRT
jgi:beta-lactam-binding protein with PASTA domain